MILIARFMPVSANVGDLDRQRWGRQLQPAGERWHISDTWLINAPGWMPVPDRRGLLFVDNMPYRQEGIYRHRTRMRLLVGFDRGARRRFDVGIEKTRDSDPKASDRDQRPYIIGRWRYEGIGEPVTLGFHVATEKNHFSTVYLMFRHVGIGFNFDGDDDEGGRARFGGYHLKNMRTDKVFLLAGGEMQLMPWGRRPVSLTADYDGDEYGIGLRYRFSDRMAVETAWRRQGDYYDLDLEDGKKASQWSFSLRKIL